eukprot:m.14457 g.14457  ORF g.14457 m.14457 type:complete len:124 (-) comp7947_c0_seq1:141-512(-)
MEDVLLPTPYDNAAYAVLAAMPGVTPVSLQKNGQPLGMRLTSEENRAAIKVDSLAPGMPAAQSGQIHVGDILLAVNHVPVVEKSHEEVIDALRRSGDPVSLLFGQRYPDRAVLDAMEAARAQA